MLCVASDGRVALVRELRQLQCAFAAQLRLACGTTTPETAVNESRKVLARQVGRPPVPHGQKPSSILCANFGRGCLFLRNVWHCSSRC
eukprot:jgi/Chlat1/8614/Chrsp86S08023